jgi:hypothetical protein
LGDRGLPGPGRACRPAADRRRCANGVASLYQQSRGSLVISARWVQWRRLTAISWPRRRPAQETHCDGGEMLLTNVSVQPAGCRSDQRERQPPQLHTGEPGTGLALAAGESVGSPQQVRPACVAGLRPGGGRCWICGQIGRADPPATAYFCCDGCDVRWYGGSRLLRHGNPAFRQREFTWWSAGRLARADYIDHAAEHTPSPA